jgi:hypothetical protein
MNDEGRHWSDPTCVLCSWLPDLDVPDGDVTDRLCLRCRQYDGASTAERIREPRSFYLSHAEACQTRASLGKERTLLPSRDSRGSGWPSGGGWLRSADTDGYPRSRPRWSSSAAGPRPNPKATADSRAARRC